MCHKSLEQLVLVVPLQPVYHVPAKTRASSHDTITIQVSLRVKHMMHPSQNVFLDSIAPVFQDAIRQSLPKPNGPRWIQSRHDKACCRECHGIPSRRPPIAPVAFWAAMHQHRQRQLLACLDIGFIRRWFDEPAMHRYVVCASVCVALRRRTHVHVTMRIRPLQKVR